MSTPGIPRAAIEAHAVTLARDLVVPHDWPRTGRAWPAARVVPILRRCGWPVEVVRAVVPHATSAGREAVQPVTVVPLVWLTLLARELGCELAAICRGTVPDA